MFVLYYPLLRVPPSTPDLYNYKAAIIIRYYYLPSTI